MSEIVTELVSVTTSGSAGAATGNADSAAMLGELLDVFLDYHASAPATTDVTITDKERGDTVLTATSTATDARHHPRAKPVDNAGAAITNAHDKFFLSGALNVAVAQCDALTNAVRAYIRYRRNG